MINYKKIIAGRLNEIRQIVDDDKIDDLARSYYINECIDRIEECLPPLIQTYIPVNGRINNVNDYMNKVAKQQGMSVGYGSRNKS